MAGFISNPPNSQSSPPAPSNDVPGDGFYPALKLADFREAMRIPTQTTELRLREAVAGAIVTTTRDLAAWKAARIAEGKVALEQAKTGDVAGEPDTVFLYRRAVYHFAAADLADTHHDIAASDEGRDRAEQRACSADELRRNGLHAVRDLLAIGASPDEPTGRVVVELI